VNATLAPGTALDRVERALRSLSAGRPVVVVANQDGQGEGHLVLAAESATTSQVAYFVRHTSGFLCVALPGADCDRLRLPPMPCPGAAASPADQRVSVDAARGVGTGISARDRARTIAALADPASTPNDFTRPGHVVPLRARDGGVLARPGCTEAAVDIARLAGLRPAALLACIVSTEDGGLTIARPGELTRFAARHRLDLVAVADLADFRLNELEPITERRGPNERTPA
jgi:3,4-dihydroxy 2-butanone 4-phosphate synthase / GTP cyclohydrolase II